MLIKKIKIILFLFLFITGMGFYYSEYIYASSGVGIIFGDPTGISLRFDNFPVLGLGWSLIDGNVDLHCDYWLKNDTIKDQFYWYLGVGGKLLIYGSSDNKNNTQSGIGLGFRVPVGLQYFIDKQFELFGELAPGIRLFPNTGFDFDGGIGIRFIFK